MFGIAKSFAFHYSSECGWRVLQIGCFIWEWEYAVFLPTDDEAH